MTPADAVEGHEQTTESRTVVIRERLAQAGAVALRVCVGTRLGLVVFLGALAFFALYWRIGLFINDSYTLANALVALADGHLWVGEAVYGPGLETPGMVLHEGAYYGRNYGQIVFSLPFLWAFEGLAAVADPGLILSMAWALVIVALGRESGRLLDRPALGASAGVICALGTFAANVAVARPLPPRLFPIVALQVSSMVAAALGVVTLYRLVARIHDRRIGLAAATVTGLATPVAFWASLPKRHVIITALVLGTCYALYRSRLTASPDDLVSPLAFRAITYGLVGLATWIHGGEAFGVFLPLVVVDVSTARSNDPRSLVIVGIALFVSLAPFFVTNVLISGSPLKPPRVLSSFQYLGTGGTTSRTGWGTFVQSMIDGLPPAVAAPVTTVLTRSSVLFGQFFKGAGALVADPGRLYRVFVRGGDIPAVSEANFSQTFYLTVLEAAPVIAGVAGSLAVGAVGAWQFLCESPRAAVTRFWSRVRSRFRLRSRPRSWLAPLNVSPARTVDAFVVALSVSFLLMYISRLPLHAQLTVRYLLPLYPLAVYAMARQASLRRILAAHWRSGLWTWAGGVLVGCQLFVVVVAARSLGRGEAVQVHALVGLAAAGVFAVLAASSVLTERFDRATAVAGGLTAALGTDFLLLSGLVYFQYGQYALPAAGWVADLLATA